MVMNGKYIRICNVPSWYFYEKEENNEKPLRMAGNPTGFQPRYHLKHNFRAYSLHHTALYCTLRQK
jgi:hypothetical protein